MRFYHVELSCSPPWKHMKAELNPQPSHHPTDLGVLLLQGIPLALQISVEVNEGHWSLLHQDQLLIQLKPVQPEDKCTWALRARLTFGAPQHQRDFQREVSQLPIQSLKHRMNI